jgi:hypothetical protein
VILRRQGGIYLISSLVALPFLASALRRGLLSARDVGMGPDGWQAWRRLLGLGLAVALTLFLYFTTETKRPPDFGDYCFWFFFLLPATMTEMLIFACLTFGLGERWLSSRGWRPAWAMLLAGAVTGVAFGLYHYTHEERFHEFAMALIPVMWLNLACFVVTRNFTLTFIVHNVVAAVGFLQSQYNDASPEDMNPALYYDPLTISVLILSFAMPYLIFSALEWRYWPAKAAATEPA